MKLSKHSLIKATAIARGTVVAERTFADEAAAQRFLVGWRNAGAYTVTTVLAPPPPPRVNPDLNGPDAPWGGWLSVEANEALDALDA